MDPNKPDKVESRQATIYNHATALIGPSTAIPTLGSKLHLTPEACQSAEVLAEFGDLMLELGATTERIPEA